MVKEIVRTFDHLLACWHRGTQYTRTGDDVLVLRLRSFTVLKLKRNIFPVKCYTARDVTNMFSLNVLDLPAFATSFSVSEREKKRERGIYIQTTPPITTGSKVGLSISCHNKQDATALNVIQKHSPTQPSPWLSVDRTIIEYACGVMLS